LVLAIDKETCNPYQKDNRAYENPCIFQFNLHSSPDKNGHNLLGIVISGHRVVKKRQIVLAGRKGGGHRENGRDGVQNLHQKIGAAGNRPCKR